MFPDFNQKTIDTIAKRAAFKCSNPDCRAFTVGPNSDPQKSTIIGEAAHIFGARPGSKRYSAHMTNITRAEITNAIWLCRNCHKLVDTDEIKHSREILFAWREQHEKYVQSELGSTADRNKRSPPQATGYSEEELFSLRHHGFSSSSLCSVPRSKQRGIARFNMNGRVQNYHFLKGILRLSDVS